MSNQTDAERIEALTAQVAALEGDLAQLRSAADMVEAGLWMCVKHERTTPYIERTSGPCGEGWSGCVWHRLYREPRR